MRELSITGYASNHARLNAASFLAYTMSFDWRLASFSADHDLEIKETKFQNVPSWGLDIWEWWGIFNDFHEFSVDMVDYRTRNVWLY